MSAISGYQQSRRNLELALKALELFLSEPVLTDRDRAGVIQAFEFSFELAWKTLQKYANSQGLEINGPKASLREGVKFRFIDLENEDKWLEMLNDRNLSSHTYKQELAAQVARRIEQSHLPALKALLAKLPLSE